MKEERGIRVVQGDDKRKAHANAVGSWTRETGPRQIWS
jgi:hypothetical protein